MDQIFNVDWAGMFVPNTPLLEIFLRGTVVYLVLFTLLRVVLKRESSGLSINDLLVIVLIADAAQNAMASDYKSITDGILLVGTIIFWSYALNWLGYHFPFLRPFIHPDPLPLVKNGRLLRHNMHRELITEEELMSQLREQGIQDLADVETACMEGDGRISVVEREKPDKARGTPERVAS